MEEGEDEVVIVASLCEEEYHIKMNETLKTAIVLAVFFFGVFGLSNFSEKERGSGKVTQNPIPSISADIYYSKEFKTYKSKLGYSFQYPDNLFITEDPDPGIPERIFVLSSAINKDDIFGVIVSVSENSEWEDPEHWIKGPYSGADLSKGYNIINVDGQEAVELEEETWVVVNTPNNKYRLSVAILPSKNNRFVTTETGISDNLLFTEINIIISSLKFAR